MKRISLNDASRLYKGKEDKKILLLSIAILFSITVIAMAMGFITSAKQNEHAINQFILELLDNKTQIAHNEIEHAVSALQTIATSPLTRDLLTAANSGKPVNLQNITPLLMSSNFYGLSITDNHHQQIYSSGSLHHAPVLALTLKLPYAGKLIWDNGVTIQLSSPIIFDNMQMGFILGEWHLEGIDAALLGIADHHINKNYYICAANKTNINCLTPDQSINALQPNQFLSLAGQKLLANDIETQHEDILKGHLITHPLIIGAYAPIDNYGIGVLISANMTLFYQSLYSQLKILLPVLLLSSLLGAILLYWQVTPLVRRILKLKQQALISKIRLRAIMDHAVEGILTIDDAGKIETCNPKAAAIFGYNASDMIGMKITKIISGLVFKQTIHSKHTQVTLLLDIAAEHPFIELTGKTKENTFFPLEIAISEIFLGKKHLYIGIVRDISERKKADEMLQASEAQFRSAFDTAPIGMALIATDGQIKKINSSLRQILGYTEEELQKMSLTAITHPEDMQTKDGNVQAIFSEENKQIKFSKRFYHKNGQIIWVLLNASMISDSKGNGLHYIAQIQDITRQKEEEDKLNHQANYDPLTGLANRNFLELSINQIIAAAQRNAKKFVIFFLDLDKFKVINDTLGHDAGDNLLKIIAERLNQHTRKSDIVARLGGDEFLLVLTELQDYQIAATFAERIISTLLKPITLKGHELFITTSIGISFFPADGTDFVTLIKNADHALYRAKENGRNNYQFCANEISSQIREKMEFENKLQAALEKDEFKIAYLPVVNAQSRKVVGFEALLRWESEEYGLVNPQRIIPIAEETGFIIPLHAWIIKTAATQILSIQTKLAQKFHLAINISARQFMHYQLLPSLYAGLADAQFDPHYFALEISENLIMQDTKLSLEIIADLAQNNIGVILDNFGTGYSSLPYLQDFAVAAIKIDRSLVQAILIDAKRTDLVVAMLKLAKNLGIKVIAEGVEKREQYEFLIAQGCDEIQGYYICPPMLQEDIVEFIQNYQPELEKI